MYEPRQLRQRLRAARRGLSRRERHSHSLSISARLAGSLLFQRSRRIAFYRSADGEADLQPLIQRARRSGKVCYLPVLRRHPELSLWFLAYPRDAKLSRNRYGILEPTLRHRNRAPPWGLDLILMPLVGFDANGNRLGMGGGYYDRTLAYLRRRRYWRRPMLIGVAHECQKVARLDPNPWDIPLNAVVTEKQLYTFTDRYSV